MNRTGLHRTSLRRVYFVGYEGIQKSVFYTRGNTPTEESHPKFGAVVGPFRTKRAAVFLSQQYGNPHCLCVNDAERIVKSLKDCKEVERK